MFRLCLKDVDGGDADQWCWHPARDLGRAAAGRVWRRGSAADQHVRGAASRSLREQPWRRRGQPGV